MNCTVESAAKIVENADAILIGAGAGMGVDSGLPDFRGNEGFWRAYPPMKKLGLSFYDLANPTWFEQDPARAWGFYGHRRNLYQATEPHAGFDILLKWANSKSDGGFVFTSNVDGHFQKAGFTDDQVVECHGAIDFEQCVGPCCSDIWKSSDKEILVDLNTFRAAGPLPSCKECGQNARPNVLMFGDGSWIETRTGVQYQLFESWLDSMSDSRIAIIELGAGTAVPTVRYQCERIAFQLGGTLVRINPREAHGRDVVSLEMGALEALDAIDQLI